MPREILRKDNVYKKHRRVCGSDPGGKNVKKRRLPLLYVLSVYLRGILHRCSLDEIKNNAVK